MDANVAVATALVLFLDLLSLKKLGNTYFYTKKEKKILNSYGYFQFK